MAGLFQTFGHGFNVRQNQLSLNRLNVAGRIDAAVHVNHVFVLKAAHHVHNRVYLADVAQKLVAQSLAVARALHKTRNVHKFQNGRRVLLRMIHLRQHVQPGVRHGHHAVVRFNGAKRIIRRLRARAGDGVKQCALAHVRKAHDAQLHSNSSNCNFRSYYNG